MPCDTGMAFLVVQHLDPAKKTLLPELLQRCTAMPVQEATDNLPVQAPASAQFDGMPKSVVAAGCADIVAPADELPARLLEYVRRNLLIYFNPLLQRRILSLFHYGLRPNINAELQTKLDDLALA